MLKKKDALVIIGNGFDRWQNLDTSYSSFQKYYEDHRDEILDKLGIGKIRVFDKDGSSFDISDVELIYGNPFKPANLDDDFWWRFEDSLATIDAYRINAFFGKDDKGLKEMAKSIDNARHILNIAFASWLESIEIGEEDTGIRFGENCYFINFNYTSTLEKRFCVDSSDIYHIHGEADDPDQS
ncbi:MAG: bacteriophage abortive infection AbiH family protein [Oscillospiraceae bacterium]|nr:bacteriophage abortive infection AbiH family protein [Oscillospiraceae bacterium]